MMGLVVFRPSPAHFDVKIGILVKKSIISIQRYLHTTRFWPFRGRFHLSDKNFGCLETHLDEKTCFGKLFFGTKTPGTSTSGGEGGGSGLDDTDQQN